MLIEDWSEIFEAENIKNISILRILKKILTCRPAEEVCSGNNVDLYVGYMLSCSGELHCVSRSLIFWASITVYQTLFCSGSD